MAKVFLDANYFIDLVEERREFIIDQFKQHKLFISPLSIHIYTYTFKTKIPNPKIVKALEAFEIISINENIIYNSLSGPTSDFEDNLQLHSSASCDCDYFLTNDKSLLSLRFFGKTRITTQILN